MSPTVLCVLGLASDSTRVEIFSLLVFCFIAFVRGKDTHRDRNGCKMTKTKEAEKTMYKYLKLKNIYTTIEVCSRS